MRPTRLTVLALLLAACGHGLDGPTPVITGISPPVVCNALDTTITLTGTGFTPVPEQVLDQTILILPVVSLVDAAGGVHAVAPVDVHWSNEASMRFVARAGQGLAPGVYDVVVTNPTGQAGRAAGALTIVPPPTLTSVIPPAICDQLTTELTLSGTDFRSDPAHGSLDVTIGDTTFTESSGAVVFVDAQTVKVSVPAGFPQGTWDVTLKNPEGCTSTLPGALTVVGPPTITSVTPPSVYNGQDTTITIAGTGFRMTPAVSLSMGGGTPIALATTFVDAQTVTAVVPMGTPEGSYTLTLTNPEGCTATITLVVSSTPPFAISGVVDPFGCSSQDTPVTISGMGFVSTPQAWLLGAGAAGADLKLKNVAFVSSTQLTGIVPQGGVIGGPYTVRVINPDGSFGEKAMAFTVTKLCPPVISNVTPSSVVHDYNTEAVGSAPIVIDGSSFLPGAEVVLVNEAGVEVAFPAPVTPPAVTVNGGGTQITLQFNAGAMNLSDGIYLVRVKTTDDPVGAGGTGATMYGDYSLFIVTNPAGKFLPAQAAKPLPAGRRGHGFVGARATAAARFLYVVGGDGGGATPTLHADSLVAALDVFGHIGDLGWQPLRKRAAAPMTGDSPNDLPSPRTGVAVTELNGWIYVVGGSTALSAAVPAPTALAPTSDIQRARLLPLSDVPILSGVGAAGGTLATGTYYYKVSTLIAAGTAGYGPNAAETLASDEAVVQVGAGQGTVQLSIAKAAGLAGAAVVGYRVYRTKVVDGRSQEEEFLADVLTTSGTANLSDDGATTPGGAHPLGVGTLSEWETAGSLLVPRAYPTVSTVVPPGGSAANLYVVGGVSSAAAAGTVERTWEYAPIDGATGALGTFGPTGLSSNDCVLAGETCMSVGRWALYGGRIDGPPGVTSDKWLLAGTGAAAMGDAVQERAQVLASGLLDAWAPVPVSGGGAFTADPRMLGAIGVYTSGHIALIAGYSPANMSVSNKDEFGTEACSAALVSGSCPLGSDFTQTAKSNSTLNVTPAVAFSGYQLTSGYLFIVGGSTDGSNAITNVQQGAQ